MAIISFWSSSKGETAKTTSIAAITTFLAIQHNYKILVLDTKYNDPSFQDCFWQEDKNVKLINNDKTKTNIASGISGLSRAILSNKTSPEIITNYTRIVFSNRLEILSDTNVTQEDYEMHKNIFNDIVKIANKYYDLIFIDIASELEDDVKKSLLEISDIIVTNIPQRIRKIDEIIKIKQQEFFKGKTIIPLLGRYDNNSKYNVKNVSRYMKEKRTICAIPYNTLFFEACNEGKVADYFIKFRKINPKDKNSVFINSVKEVAERIIDTLKELQMRM